MGIGMKFKKGDMVVTQDPAKTLMSHLPIPEGSVVEIVVCEQAHGFDYYGFKTKSGAFGNLYGFSLTPALKEKD